MGWPLRVGSKLAGLAQKAGCATIVETDGCSPSSFFESLARCTISVECHSYSQTGDSASSITTIMNMPGTGIEEWWEAGPPGRVRVWLRFGVKEWIYK